MKWLEKLTLGLSIAASFELLEAQVKTAPPGAKLVGPVVKGLKVWGREIDLPLDPLVRK